MRNQKYDHIRVFGCTCFAQNKVGDKFASKSRKYVFVGYLFGKKGWKLYDLEENKFFESRDVRFCEEIFPFASHKLNKSQDTFSTPKLDNMWIDEENGSAEDASPVNNSVDVDDRGSGSAGLTPTSPDLALADRGSCGQQSTIPFGPAEAALLTPEIEPKDSATQQHAQAPEIAQQVPNRCQRTRRPPAKLDDYVCCSAHIKNPILTTNSCQQKPSGTCYPLHNYVTCTNFSPSHQQVLAAIMKVDEPRFYHEAVKQSQWRQALIEEVEALENNGTWQIINLPLGKKPIRCKWVYRVKYNSDGSIH